MKIAREAALALSVLEQKKVVHRDIAARNFLGKKFLCVCLFVLFSVLDIFVFYFCFVCSLFVFVFGFLFVCFVFFNFCFSLHKKKKIIVDSHGAIKLSDFGMARITNSKSQGKGYYQAFNIKALPIRW
jgi:serine/threonine protein kinase